MVLLAYDDINKSPYKELGTEEQLKKLSSIINLEILSAQMQSTGKNKISNSYFYNLKRDYLTNYVKIIKMVTNAVKIRT